MTKIRILKDEQFSTLMQSLAKVDDRVPPIMEAAADDGYAIPEGTVINDAEISERGVAYYYHPESGVVWYSPHGWFEVIE